MSIELIESFKFFHEDTPMHHLDPRSKGMLLLTYSILAFLFNSLILLAIVFFSLLPIIISARLINKISQGLRGLMFLIFLILFINTWVDSLNFALIIILRILILMIMFSIFFQTTSPEDLSQALVKMKIPYAFAFSLSLAFRFVPTMATETQIITDAQKSRGHKIETGGILSQIRNLIPLLVPLLLNSIRRAFNVAEALETRSFGVNRTPNPLYPIKFNRRDWLILFTSLAIIIIGFSIQYFWTQYVPLFSYSLSI